MKPKQAPSRNFSLVAFLLLAPLLLLGCTTPRDGRASQPTESSHPLAKEGTHAETVDGPAKPFPPPQTKGGPDLTIRWGFDGYVGEVGGGPYPADGANGGPDHAYILAKCQATETLLRELEPTIQALSCFKRPLYSDVIRKLTALEWARQTAPLHRKIFEALEKQPDIVVLELMLSDQWLTAEDSANAKNAGCALYYRNSPPRVLGFHSDNLDHDVGLLDPAHRDQYGLRIESQHGSEGGVLSLAVRLRLRCPSPDYEDSAGKTVITFSFNPFVKHAPEDWQSGLDARLVFSEDFRTVTRLE